MAELAAQVRRLGDAVITRRLPAELAGDAAGRLAAIAAEIERAPRRSKVENFGLRNRISAYMETGSWPDPPADGSRIEFDVASAIGGELNPFSVGARYYRDGDEVVGRVTVAPPYEGPPERVHGGMICAIFDEVMGCVFRATGIPSAFTGQLNVRFEAPAPLETELEFRARLVSRDGRKNYLEAEARCPEGQVASATATFIEMRIEQFLADSEANP